MTNKLFQIETVVRTKYLRGYKAENEDIAIMHAEQEASKGDLPIECIEETEVTCRLYDDDDLFDSKSYDIVNAFPELSTLSGEARKQALETIDDIIKK